MIKIKIYQNQITKLKLIKIMFNKDSLIKDQRLSNKYKNWIVIHMAVIWEIKREYKMKV
jgi:hypothetical protein